MPRKSVQAPRKFYASRLFTGYTDPVRGWFADLLGISDDPAQEALLKHVQDFRDQWASASDPELRERWGETGDMLEAIAIAALVAERVLGMRLFDVQLRGSLALAAGRIAEMLTGEGKTLAAVPAVAWLARNNHGVHVMTANDYLARRDAAWMGPVFSALGLQTGCVQQGQTPEQRRAAYAADIVYSPANEIGFDYLRDQMAVDPAAEVHRPFFAAVIDEADSILIDEARIPLVIAGGDGSDPPLGSRVDAAVRALRRGLHFTVDDYGRNVALTDSGIQQFERSVGCGNLYAEANLDVLTAAQNALHAHALLHRDVDYLVKNGRIESVDEWKGRIAQDRRWPAGLHTAIEVKEGVAIEKQGRILGSITLQHLVALYPHVSGMTGTAVTQADEFQKIYQLTVEAIPPNRPVIRNDLPDAVFPDRRSKEQAILRAIREAHSSGQPVLVGTASVAESESLSSLLGGVPHRVLNARNDEEEAAIVAAAGERGAVTISTNMAGRGVDIRLGEGAAELGGLFVIGTNKHESRRIDNQLRGRAGRQGDPGKSRFFVSYEDDLYHRFQTEGELRRPTPDDLQRRVEGQNVSIREFLNKYESIVEGQRLLVQEMRREILRDSEREDLERLASLLAIDDAWANHLFAVAEIRDGVHLVSWAGRDPLHEYLTRVDALYEALEAGLDEAIAAKLAELKESGVHPGAYIPGATWTYLTTDNPFGSLTERILKAIFRKKTS